MTWLFTLPPDPIAYFGNWSAATGIEIKKGMDFIVANQKKFGIPICMALGNLDSLADNQKCFNFLNEIETPENQIRAFSYNCEHLFLYNGVQYPRILDD